MKITTESSKNKKEFGSLSYGDILKDSDGGIFIKITSFEGSYSEINAIRLCNGHRCHIDNMELVTPLDAELIIKGVKE